MPSIVEVSGDADAMTGCASVSPRYVQHMSMLDILPVRMEAAAVARREVFIELVTLGDQELRLPHHLACFVGMRLLEHLVAHFAITVLLERDARTRRIEAEG